jgi:hypothetical protein
LKFKGVPVVPHPGAGQFQPVHKPHWGVSWKPQAGKSVPSESAAVNAAPLESAPGTPK